MIKKVSREKEEKSMSSMIKTCVIFLIIVFAIFMTARYITDEDFRSSFDTYILKKEVNESSLGIIEINSDANPYVFAYDKYISVLSKNSLTKYLSDGTVAGKFDVSISVPLVDSNGKYLVLAETDGQRIYLISNSNIIWQNTLAGNISRVSVNKNGYVSVIITDTTYKSVIIVFNPDGTELFKKYLSNNYAICTDISDNNKYLAIGEVEYSGTIVKSYVNIISIELAQSEPENSILYTYESESGEIIMQLDYKNKNEAICMFNSYVQKVTHENDERMHEVTENNLFIDVNLDDSIAVLSKQSSGLFSYEYDLNFKNVENNIEKLYILEHDVPKSLVAKNNIIGLNFGNEAQIVNSSGWLMKKYTSNKQIQSIVLADNIAGIVYKDKIEIIGL